MSKFHGKQGHGLRRTNADKRRAVMAALAHPNGRGLSDRLIAEHCGVSDPFVGTVRAELQTVSSLATTEKRKGKDGKQRGEQRRSRRLVEEERKRAQTSKARESKANKRAAQERAKEGSRSLTPLEALRDVLTWINENRLIVEDDVRQRRWVEAAR